MIDRQPLSVHMLGGFHIRVGHEEVVGFDQTRLRLLLAYLLLHRRAPVARQQLAFAFWPDSPDAQALNNLRTLLTRLRQVLPEANRCIDSTFSTIQWRDDASYQLDVAEFEDALQQGSIAAEQANSSDTIRAFQAAVDLYTGDLLPGFYDEWLIPEQERLRQAYLDALDRLAALLEGKRRYKEALGIAQRLVRADPLHEAVYRQLMQLHLALGNRAAALRVYHACATILRHELGVDPSPATQEVHRRVLANENSSSNMLLEAATPTANASFVGRHAEWEAILRAWRQAAAGQVQIVLINGEAGIGKTRLAEELLAWANHQGVATAVARCYTSGSSLAFGPVAEWLRSDTVQARLRSLDRIWLVEVARLLPELLLSFPNLPAPGPMTEPWQRQRFFQALARAFVPERQSAAKRPERSQWSEGPPVRRQTVADGPPLLLFLDDLQWCDQETLDWLQYFVQAATAAPLLLVGTVRIEEAGDDHPLIAFRQALARHSLHELTLSPLTAAESALLAANLLGHTLSRAQAGQLFADTEGNPLFVVETVRAGMGKGAAAGEAGERGTQQKESLVSLSTTSSLPPKVRAVIQRRLSMVLPGAHALAQTAAVIGREFGFEVLARASGPDEGAVVHVPEAVGATEDTDFGELSRAENTEGAEAVSAQDSDIALGILRRRLWQRMTRPIAAVGAHPPRGFTPPL